MYDTQSSCKLGTAVGAAGSSMRPEEGGIATATAESMAPQMGWALSGFPTMAEKEKDGLFCERGSDG